MSEYLIWSNEHGAWWGPGERGYVANSRNAGRYSREQALDICAKAMPGMTERLGMLPEIPVRAEDVEFMRRRFAGRFGDREPEPVDAAS